MVNHEITHAALRHGTNQLSKQLLISAPLSMIGGLMGQSGGWKEQLAAMGISVFSSGLLLKYSRNAESQADPPRRGVLGQAQLGKGKTI